MTNFHAYLMEGAQEGTVTYNAGKATITGAVGSRYGLMSAPIQNSSTNWTGIEAEVAEYSGTNALMQINGSEDGSLSNFIEFGIENNRLAVYTASGAGNWSGQAVTFPCKLRVELSPLTIFLENNSTMIYCIANIYINGFC